MPLEQIREASSVFWRCGAQVEEVIGDRQVDLIDIETASPSLCKAIERYGKAL